MYLALLDGLDSLIEYYIPLAREYPIAPLIILFILALPLIALAWVYRAWRKGKT
jgi:hypothetical protein